GSQHSANHLEREKTSKSLQAHGGEAARTASIYFALCRTFQRVRFVLPLPAGLSFGTSGRGRRTRARARCGNPRGTPLWSHCRTGSRSLPPFSSRTCRLRDPGRGCHPAVPPWPWVLGGNGHQSASSRGVGPSCAARRRPLTRSCSKTSTWRRI